MKFSMKNMKSAFILMNNSIKLDDKISKILSWENHKLYWRIIEKLIFAAVTVQIDIVFTVNKLSQYFSESHKIHLQAAKHIFWYLKNSSNLEILYKFTSVSDLVEYADAAYINAYQFKSTTDFCYMINEVSVSLTSKWQSITAQSIIELEYITLSKTGKQAVWLHHLLYVL